jgi:hypothetical protein
VRQPGRTRRCSRRRGPVGFLEFVAHSAPAAAELGRSAPGGRQIDPILDPWDVVWSLEGRDEVPGFLAQWRGFVRSVVPQLAGLPSEAAQWWEAADAYEAGRLDRAGLASAQQEALRYLLALPTETPESAYSAVRAAMQPLWDHNDGGGWFHGALTFLHDCGAAGMGESVWWTLLRAALPELGAGSEAEPFAAPDGDERS